MAEKITLDAEDLYIIRSNRTKPCGEVVVTYYESPPCWNKAPVQATLFTSYEIAEAHMSLFRERDAGECWADGSVEVLDVVPLYGEILHSPNASTVHVKR